MFVCDFSHTKTATNHPENTGNWQEAGGNLTATSGSSGQSTVEHVTRLDIGLNISRALSGSSIGLGTNASGDLADYTINLDPDDFVSSTPTPTTSNSVLKWGILMGNQGTPSTVSLAGATRNYTPFTAPDLNSGNPYYLIYGVQVSADGSAVEAATGSQVGIFTTDNPTGTVTAANSFNVIG